MILSSGSILCCVLYANSYSIRKFVYFCIIKIYNFTAKQFKN